MKTKSILIILLLGLVHISFGQKDLEKKLKEKYWLNALPEFRVKTVPQQWKNESAVILASSIEYQGSFSGITKNFTESIVIHYRVLLQDKAAVREYSELTFNQNKINTNILGKANAYSLVAVKIVKPNGSEKEMDLSSAVKTDAGSEKDSKIAVPDLDTGDIIDFFIAIQARESAVPYISESDLLEEKYPVMNKRIQFILPRQVSFSSKSFRGAPEFIKSKTGKTNVYTLVDTMRGKAPEILWDFPHRSSAEVRYKVSGGKNNVFVSGELTARDALRTFDYNSANINWIEDFIQQNFKEEKDQRKIVEEVYYLLRNPVFQKAYFNVDQENPLNNQASSEKIFFLLNKFLVRHNINHDVMIIPSRSFGPLDDLININSCDLLIKVNTDSSFYISRPSPFSIPGEVSYLLEGMEGVASRYPKHDNWNGFNETIPISGMENNSTSSIYKIVLDSGDLSKINVKRDVLVKGYNKPYHQYLIATNHEYLQEYDNPKYQNFSLIELKALAEEFSRNKFRSAQQAIQENYERDRRVEDDVEAELETKISDYRNLQIKSLGMWNETPDTEYGDEFSIENGAKHAGKNLIIEVGKFIEKQTELSEEQLQRGRDIHMGFARSFFTEIRVKIPSGYKVEGAESLNKKVINEYGGFVSTAETQGDELVIHTQKYYTKNYCSSTDWTLMTEFLNAAVLFSKSKILLKKL